VTSDLGVIESKYTWRHSHYDPRSSSALTPPWWLGPVIPVERLRATHSETTGSINGGPRLTERALSDEPLVLLSRRDKPRRAAAVNRTASRDPASRMSRRARIIAPRLTWRRHNCRSSREIVQLGVAPDWPMALRRVGRHLEVGHVGASPECFCRLLFAFSTGARLLRVGHEEAQGVSQLCARERQRR
jgi:hypothetical protein